MKQHNLSTDCVVFHFYAVSCRSPIFAYQGGSVKDEGFGIMRIKELCPDERPREKMRLRGAKALSNADLLAILLGSGTGGRSVIDVAQELMVSAGGRLSLLGVMPLEKLVSHKGVGEARAITIAAALELGRRALEEQVIVDKRAITSPEMVYQFMLPQLKNLDHEECWVLYLNRSNFLKAGPPATIPVPLPTGRNHCFQSWTRPAC